MFIVGNIFPTKFKTSCKLLQQISFRSSITWKYLNQSNVKIIFLNVVDQIPKLVFQIRK